MRVMVKDPRGRVDVGMTGGRPERGLKYDEGRCLDVENTVLK